MDHRTRLRNAFRVALLVAVIYSVVVGWAVFLGATPVTTAKIAKGVAFVVALSSLAGAVVYRLGASR